MSEQGDNTNVNHHLLGVVLVLNAQLRAYNRAEYEDKKKKSRRYFSIEDIVMSLRRVIGDDSIKLIFHEEGSIKFFLEGSPESLKKVEELFESRELTEVQRIPVEEVQLVWEESGEVEEETEEKKKYHLIKEIKTQGAENRDLRGTNLKFANLSDANLSRANLTGVDLRANLSSTNLKFANLSDANLKFANLSSANLSGANLYGAIMCGTILSYTNVNHADLSGVNLNDANLNNADLSNAKLNHAYLSGANFSGANLTDANLSGANVEQTMFGYNQGISESMRSDLISRGAIFEDFPEDYARTRSLVPSS